MSTSDLKLSIHNLIEGITDSSVLQAVHTLLSKSNAVQEDWYDNLTDDAKASINRGLDDLKNGRVHSHEEVMRASRERITKFSK